ncbi:TcaA NTF2-like domain-containing protein [Cohnella hashimotonis]|uniref:TcaA protein NTF2-like domain-containing protein n=1 Tax=Cohnella hashimotonis TaxID=2826895 RepID=A0ABT6TQX7_9BACL|nr:hypothetical protein [Cohnella hashimotonis]MDI4649252.1 hypothetical protein [Cohnella hashimotonis]
MKAKFIFMLMLMLVLISGVIPNPYLNSFAASAAKQADKCSIDSNSGAKLVIGDPYLGDAFLSVYCGYLSDDGDLANQAIFKIDSAYLTITKQSAVGIAVTAKKAGIVNVQATMPDKSVVSLKITIMTKQQYDASRDPNTLTIDEALALVRMKINDVHGEYGYSSMYSDGGYVFRNMNRGEALGESEIFRIDPESGTVYGYLDDQYIDNLMVDKHDPPFTPEQCAQLLKERFLKTVPANQTVEATGNYSKGRIEIGVFSMIKSAKTGKMVANYNSNYTTYLVDPATGDVFNAISFAYKGSISSVKITRTKNRTIYVNDLLQDYYRKLSTAVNENRLSALDDMLKPGSTIDKQQRQFAKSMYSSGTKEQFGKTYKIDHTEQVSPKLVKIYVMEQTSVTPKRGKTRTVEEKWMYQAEKETYAWRFTEMRRW